MGEGLPSLTTSRYAVRAAVVCVCVREKEREREVGERWEREGERGGREGGRERERERERGGKGGRDYVSHYLYFTPNDHYMQPSVSVLHSR